MVHAEWLRHIGYVRPDDTRIEICYPKNMKKHLLSSSGVDFILTTTDERLPEIDAELAV